MQYETLPSHIARGSHDHVKATLPADWLWDTSLSAPSDGATKWPNCLNYILHIEANIYPMRRGEVSIWALELIWINPNPMVQRKPTWKCGKGFTHEACETALRVLQVRVLGETKCSSEKSVTIRMLTGSVSQPWETRDWGDIVAWMVRLKKITF